MATRVEGIENSMGRSLGPTGKGGEGDSFPAFGPPDSLFLVPPAPPLCTISSHIAGIDDSNAFI